VIIIGAEYWAPEIKKGRKTKGVQRISGWINCIIESKNNNKIDKVKLFGG
jgi:hypothetical protein